MPRSRTSSSAPLVVLAALAAALTSGACGGDGSPKPAPDLPTHLAFAAQPDSALVGDSVALGAAALNSAGTPLPTYSATYTSSDTTVARVDVAGLVRFVGVGRAVVTARVPRAAKGDTLTLATPSLVVLARAAKLRLLPTRIDAAPGVKTPLSAAVYDAAGNQILHPLAYTSDNAAVATVAAGTVTAGASGTAQVTVRAEFRGRGVSASIPVTVAPLSAGAFHIDLVAVGTVNPAYASIFAQAATYWQTVITAALPAASLNVPANACDDGTPAVSRSTTGVVILFGVDSIDGVGKVLGEAGPCVLRGDATTRFSGLPSLGVMHFDSADFGRLVQQGTAVDVIRHEMGHVLGIGTLWNLPGVRSYVTAAGTVDPQYVGSRGESGSAVLGFTLDGVGVPVENVGGPGTADSHWRSSVFGSELMTGYLGRASTHPASRVTVLSLEDLGYAVNVAAAEPLLPATATLAMALGVRGEAAKALAPAGGILVDRPIGPRYVSVPGGVRRVSTGR